jgi:hypothetical protein
MRRAALFTAALIAVAIIVRVSRTPARPPAIVVLKAERCGTCNDVRAGAAVLLIDTREFSPDASFDLELVDRDGRRVDSGQGIAVSALTLAYSCPELASGRYYLRLRENGTLRREFAIHVS